MITPDPFSFDFIAQRTERYEGHVRSTDRDNGGAESRVNDRRWKQKNVQGATGQRREDEIKLHGRSVVIVGELASV